MKIAHVVCVYPPYKGGIGESAHDYFEALKNKGYDIEVFTPSYNKIVSSEDKRIHRLTTFLKFGNGAFVPGLFFKLKNFDIVHLHYPFFGGAELVYLASLFFRFKLVLHYHMDTLSLSWPARFLSIPSLIIRKRLLKKSDLIVCSSQDYIENSAVGKDFYENRFLELPFAVDLEKYFPEEKNATNNLLFVGALDKAHYFKGLDNLIHALSKIDNSDWSLRVVGDGDLKDSYVKQCEKLGLNNQVEFLGRVSDKNLEKIYRSSSFIVLPSINSHEAFGIVLIEAMASGLAVIASDLAGVRTVFRDGVDGKKVAPNDTNDLKEKIEHFLNNPDKVKKYSQNARVYAEERYDQNKVIKKLINAYKEL